MEFNIVLIPGDGIGPEVISSAVGVLDRVAEKFNHKFNFTEVYAGGCAIDKFGEPLPQETIDKCKESDSVLLGAVGGAVGGNNWDKLPGDKRPERALLGLRAELGLYGNLRPAILYRELLDACPLRADIAQKGIDIMVVRELTGGMYFGVRGRSVGSMGEEAYDTEKYSVDEVRRISKIAFDIAMQRNKKVTSVDKANVLESSRLWRTVVIDTAKQYPEIELEHMYVDNASMQLIKNPQQFDVILTTNMFGDILSDEASMITGSIGMLPSASLGKTTRGMYEPIHGSAPDIAGMDLANPIATILSAAMMLKYSFKLEKEAEAIDAAIKKVLAKGYRTSDIYNKTQIDAIKIGTSEMTKLIIENI